MLYKPIDSKDTEMVRDSTINDIDDWRGIGRQAVVSVLAVLITMLNKIHTVQQVNKVQSKRVWLIVD